MKSSALDVIVIGAGHAGLSISYHLKKHELNHIVFEQGQTGDSWRNQRWDSFRLNTANKVNLLPGQENVFPDAEGYISASEYVSFLESYAMTFKLPVSENKKVVSVEKLVDSGRFSVKVNENGSIKQFTSDQVVVTSGGQNKKLMPSFAANISPGIVQLHTADYRNAESLPSGAVLVVGSAQSGMQIAEDLIADGREVFISASKVGRVPRRYRGKDIVDWFNLTGFNDVKTADVTDPQVLLTRQPQVSGAGPGGHTTSLQALAGMGTIILGNLQSAHSFNLNFEPNAASHVKFADDFSKKIKTMIDDYIQRSQLDSQPPEEDFADVADINCSCASSVSSLNMIQNKITSIIWTTGFAADFSYLKLPVFNNSGSIKHFNGISEIEGLYFLGLQWLRKRKSGIILGIREDSEYIADLLIANRR